MGTKNKLLGLLRARRLRPARTSHMRSGIGRLDFVARAICLMALGSTGLGALAQPTISSISPRLGSVGSSVLVNGTGFSTIPSENIVFVGATRGTVTAATATQLSVSVPAGASYDAISVLNTGTNLSATARPGFLPVFDSTGTVTDSVGMESRVEFTANSGPGGIVSKDLDGDGKPDIAVANYSSSSISIFRNTGSSGSITTTSFAAKVDFSTGTHPIGLVTEDMDGDGRPDLICSDQHDGTVSVFRNASSSGTISFESRVTAAVSDGQQLAVGDIDGDGRPDIATINNGGNLVYVVKNNSSSGSLSFASAISKSVANGPAGAAIADIDGDGKNDLLVSCYNGGQLSIFRNIGSAGSITTGSFDTRQDFATGVGAYNIYVGDVDGDGKRDVLVSNNNGAKIGVFRNASTSGTISLATRVDLTATTGAAGMGMGDINGDGKPDIAVANYAGNAVSVFLNTSSGIGNVSFATRRDFAAGTNPNFVTVDDLDGDGLPDLAYGMNGSTKMAVMRNRPLSTVSGPTSVCVGATISLAAGVAGGSWSSSSPAVATVGSLSGIVTGVSAGTATISYNLSGGITSVVVTVGTVSTGTISGNIPVCEGSDIALSETVSDGTWVSGNSSVATVGSTSGTVSGVSAGTALLSYVVTGACSAAATTVVTVNARPVISGAGSVNAGDVLTLTATPSGGTWSSANPGIASVNAGGVVTGVATGLATISYAAVSGCTAVHTVSVNAATLSPISGSLGVCMGSTTVLYCASAPGTSWTISDTSIATVGITSGLVIPVAPGTATVTFTAYSGATVTGVITVNPLPEAITGTAFVCTGNTTTLSSATSGGAWSSSMPTFAAVNSVGVVSGLAAGTSVITYTLPTGCKVLAVVSVGATPGAVSGATSLCVGGNTTVVSGTPGCTWSSSDPAVATVSSAGIVSGLTAGTTVISYTHASGCEQLYAVTVNAGLSANSGYATVCVGQTSLLSNSSSGGSWSSSNHAKATVNAASGVVTGVYPGTANISYTLGAGCYSVTQVTVTSVLPAITGPVSVNTGDNITLGNAWSGGAWSSSNMSAGTISTGGVVTGISGGTTGITYTLGSCYTHRTVTVNAPPPAIGGISSLCVGEHGALPAPASGGASWSSSDGSVATIGLTSGVIEALTPGTTVITFTLTTGAYSTKVFTVNANPAAISGTAAVCKAATTTLSCASSGGTWTSGNVVRASVNAVSGVVMGVNAGNAMITYTWTNGCRVTQSVTVLPLPVAGAITGPGLVHAGSSVTLVPSTAGGVWSSGDISKATVTPASGSSATLTGVSTGTVRITYTVSGTCGTAFVSRQFIVAAPRPGGPAVVAKDVAHVAIFPNPSSGYFTITVPEDGSVTLVSMEGRVVASLKVGKPTSVISFPDGLSEGLYLVRFTGEEGTVVTLPVSYRP